MRKTDESLWWLDWTVLRTLATRKPHRILEREVGFCDIDPLAKRILQVRTLLNVHSFVEIMKLSRFWGNTAPFQCSV
jgi:hypothetical protein